MFVMIFLKGLVVDFLYIFGVCKLFFVFEIVDKIDCGLNFFELIFCFVKICLIKVCCLLVLVIVNVWLYLICLMLCCKIWIYRVWNVEI